MKEYTVLKSLHGSHLYGLARSDSDIDYYEIYDYLNQRYRPKRQSSQTIVDAVDSMRISLERFESLCLKGVPQALETLFSPSEAWTYVDDKWHDISTQIKSNLRNHMPEIMKTYRRTALNFFDSKKDQVKKRRHAFRLLLNIQELKTSGQMQSRLNEDQIALVDYLNTCFGSEEKFKDMVYQIF